MLNVIIFFTLLGLLAIPSKKYEDWGRFTKIYFGVILLLFVLFFFKFFFIY